MTAIVYLATNRLNGHRYIGASGKSLRERKYFHEWHALYGKRIQCRYFHAALRKYGIDAFDWTVLIECDDFATALREEIRLISEIVPEYNLTTGGQGSAGRKLTKEQRERHAERMRGKRKTPEQRARQSAAQMGRVFSIETRRKISEANKGKPKSPEHVKKAAEARRGLRQSSEWIEKRRQKMLGRRLTAEHKAKVSAALKGHPGALKGQKRNPEFLRRAWITRRAKQEVSNYLAT
jgi:group I intron endonuclease